MLEKKTLNEALALIERSASIFIAFPPSPDPDVAASAEIIARRLAKLGKKISSSPKEGLPSIWGFLPLEALQNAAPLTRDLRITIDTRAAPVGELKYEKDETTLAIVLTPKEKPLTREAVQIAEGAAEADLVITIGASTLDGLGELFQKNPRLFFETPIVALDHSPAHDHHGEVNLINVKAAAITEISWNLAALLSPDPMSTDEATLILAGVLSKTRNFLDGKVMPDTLSLAAECIRRGGQREATLKALSESEALPALQLFGRAIARTRLISSPEIYLAIITADDFKKSGTAPADVPRVLSHLEEHLAAPAKILLLWQTPEGRSVSFMLRTRDRMILRESERLLGGRVTPGIFIGGVSYLSFQDAERELLPFLARLSQNPVE